MVRILLIDDDPQVLGMLAEMLRPTGYEIVTAMNGREGVQLYRQSPFDLVITDILMPEKDGLEVVLELRQDFPNVKLVTLSGGDSRGHYSLESSRAFGAARSLRKPFTAAQLLETVREVLESS